MSLKIRKRIKTPTGLFFTSMEIGKRVEVRVDLFFMSPKIRKRIKPRFGLFFMSFEMKERVEVRVALFFISLKTRKRIKTRVGLFSRDSFFLTLACYNGNRKSKGG